MPARESSSSKLTTAYKLKLALKTTTEMKSARVCLSSQVPQGALTLQGLRNLLIDSSRLAVVRLTRSKT